MNISLSTPFGHKNMYIPEELSKETTIQYVLQEYYKSFVEPLHMKIQATEAMVYSMTYGQNTTLGSRISELETKLAMLFALVDDHLNQTSSANRSI